MKQRRSKSVNDRRRFEAIEARQRKFIRSSKSQTVVTEIEGKTNEARKSNDKIERALYGMRLKN